MTGDPPPTLDLLTPAFLTRALGRPILSVNATPLGEPQTSVVAALEVRFEDGVAERLVAKLPHPHRRNPTQYAREVAFYRGVGGHLACVPRLRFSALNDDGDFLLLLEAIEGRHVREGFDGDTARLTLSAIAKVHGRFWGNPGDLPVRVYTREEVEGLAASVREGWEGVTSRFPRWLEEPPQLDPAEAVRLEPTTLTHNDLHADNLLVHGQRVVFLDWQNAVFGSPYLDLANLICGCTLPDVQRLEWRALLAHYQAALIEAGGPELPNLAGGYATATKLLFAWMVRYLADVPDEEAATRIALLPHWERVCTGVSQSDGDASLTGRASW